MLKTCIKCLIEKELNNFRVEKHKNGKSYTRNVCKKCKQNQYNKDKKRARDRKYGKIYRKKRTTYERNRIKYDVQYRLTRNLRSRLRAALKNKQKYGSAIKDLGCSIEELKRHLEKQFINGMSWDNYGEWHIDHIKALSLYNLENKEEFIEANNYLNLQPLWAKDNIKKSNKL